MSEMPDMNELLQQAMAMQQQLMEAQAQAAEQVVMGAAGGGKVRISMAGTGEVLSVAIDPEVVDPTDVEILEDLVLAAFRDALAKVQDIQSQAMGGLPGGLGGLLGS
jgi:nucleoid-associated protein EbfC